MDSTQPASISWQHPCKTASRPRTLASMPPQPQQWPKSRNQIQAIIKHITWQMARIQGERDRDWQGSWSDHPGYRERRGSRASLVVRGVVGGDHGPAAFPEAIHVATGIARAEAELGEELVLLFRERPHRSIDPAKAKILISRWQKGGVKSKDTREKIGRRRGEWGARERERRRWAYVTIDKGQGGRFPGFELDDTWTD